MVQNNVGVVTLTYGDRFDYVSKNIKATLDLEHVKKMVVVMNGVSETTLSKLNNLSINEPKLIIHDLEHNAGSAKGFKEGIEKILEEDIEFIWLIDDDNLPQRDALCQLLKHWKLLNKENKPLYSLLSYRPDRNVYKEAIQRNNPYFMLGPDNSFLGFHLIKKIKHLFFKDEKVQEIKRTGKVAVAPYGGMFFKRELIKLIGLPNESFFLYADDHDFSYRITKNGGEIVLVLDSVLTDLEKSFHLKKQNRVLKTRFFSTNSKDAIFYSVRNNIYFECNFVESPIIYNLNKTIYIILLFFVMISKPKDFWKFRLILKAIYASKQMTND
ncbi:glycosyltransferase [Winogradskyella wichelsiae]|uniref:glycosyltransferase n=1 Tax=Winogradskyella wichelsiae TaxID=2697007 RepID=UPI003EFA13E2